MKKIKDPEIAAVAVVYKALDGKTLQECHRILDLAYDKFVLHRKPDSEHAREAKNGEG